MGKGKIKIFVFGRDKIGWSIDEDRKNIIYFLKLNKFEIVNSILKATHIFCVWYDLLYNLKYKWIAWLGKFLNKKIIVVITNDITNTPQKLNFLKNNVSVCITPSIKIEKYLTQHHIRTYKIPFFVNPSHFKNLGLSKKEICNKLKLDYKKLENKIIIGSLQRDSLGKDLLKPKWQKNPELLIKILKLLPKEKFILLLAGPRRHYIIKRCLEEKIDFIFFGNYSYIKRTKDDILVNNLPLEKINYLYNLADIYIITSKSEGGPKQVVESALTKTLIFSTKVGLAPDFLHPYLLFKENQLQFLISKIKDFFASPETFSEYIEYNFQKAKKEMSLEILSQKYKKVILENLK